MMYFAHVRAVIVAALYSFTLVLVTGCSTEQEAVFAKVVTKPISSVTLNTAQSGGYILHDGKSDVTATGVCWNLTGDPSIADPHTQNTSVDVEFTTSLSNLHVLKNYYVSAYATNSVGTSYGNVVRFRIDTTQSGQAIIGDPDHLYFEGAGVSDLDGNFYPTILLGSQEWMAKNLRTTRFCDGGTISPAINLNTWETEPAYTSYNNDQNNLNEYGYLYNYPTVRDTGNVCPCGWHIPTQEDMIYLTAYIGGIGQAGGLMKTTGTLNNGDGLWYTPNAGASNKAGFSAKPGGYVENYNSFSAITAEAYWWMNEGYKSFTVNYNFVQLNFEVKPDTYGMSIRCLKD